MTVTNRQCKAKSEFEVLDTERNSAMNNVFRSGRDYFQFLSIVMILAIGLGRGAVAQEGQREEEPEKSLKPPVITGYAQINYLQFVKEPSKDKESGFEISRVRFAFEGEIIPEKLEYAIEFDPQGTPILDDTYLDYMFSEKARFRAGRYKIPFGAENPTGEDELTFIEKSRIVESVFSAREVGIGTLFDISKLSGDVGYFQKAEDEHIERDVIGHLGIKPFGRLLDVGASGYFEHISTDSTRFTINRIGLDGTITAGPIQLQGEAIFSKGTVEDKRIDAFGYYGHVLYNHKVGDTPVSWGLRCEYYDPDRNVSNDHEFRYIVGSTVQVHPQMRFQINYQRIVQVTAGPDDVQNKVIAMYQFNF